MCAAPIIRAGLAGSVAVGGGDPGAAARMIADGQAKLDGDRAAAEAARNNRGGANVDLQSEVGRELNRGFFTDPNLPEVKDRSERPVKIGTRRHEQDKRNHATDQAATRKLVSIVIALVGIDLMRHRIGRPIDWAAG